MAKPPIRMGETEHEYAERMARNFPDRYPLPDADSEPTRGEVLAFLRGEGPIKGRWFGDRVPLRWGSFWWRRYLDVLQDPLPAADKMTIGRRERSPNETRK